MLKYSSFFNVKENQMQVYFNKHENVSPMKEWDTCEDTLYEFLYQSLIQVYN